MPFFSRQNIFNLKTFSESSSFDTIAYKYIQQINYFAYHMFLHNRISISLLMCYFIPRSGKYLHNSLKMVNIEHCPPQNRYMKDLSTWRKGYGFCKFLVQAGPLIPIVVHAALCHTLFLSWPEGSWLLLRWPASNIQIID